MVEKSSIFKVRGKGIGALGCEPIRFRLAIPTQLKESLTDVEMKYCVSSSENVNRTCDMRVCELSY